MGFQVTDASGKLKVSVVANTLLSNSDTGAQNNWSPGIGDDTLISWSGASDMTVTGFAAGTSGRRLRFINTGSKVAYFSHQSGSSSAGNKLRNTVTSSSTPVAAGGTAAWQYDGTDWRLVAHEQGALISVPYAAGNFTGNAAMTWTVDAGDQITYSYAIVGKLIFVFFALNTTTVGGVVDLELRIALPNGFLAVSTTVPAAIRSYDNAVDTVGFCGTVATLGYIRCWRGGFSAWAASVNNTAVQGLLVAEV